MLGPYLTMYINNLLWQFLCSNSYQSMWTFPLPPFPSACLASNVKIIHKWAIETQCASNEQLTIILGMLDKNYLPSIQLLPSQVFHKGLVESCHWFKKFISWVLGWTKCWEEGHLLGFNTKVNHEIKEVFWLDRQRENEDVGSDCLKQHQINEQPSQRSLKIIAC